MSQFLTPITLSDGSLLYVDSHQEPFQRWRSQQMRKKAEQLYNCSALIFKFAGSLLCLADRTFRASFLLQKPEKKTSHVPKEPKIYRNPVYVARECLTLIHNNTYPSVGALARAKGITTPRASQIMKVLELTDEVIEIVESLGDPLPAPIVTERKLRLLVHLPREEQIRQVKEMLEE